jgi:hypothetical protein
VEPEHEFVEVEEEILLADINIVVEQVVVAELVDEHLHVLQQHVLIVQPFLHVTVLVKVSLLFHQRVVN